MPGQAQNHGGGKAAATVFGRHQKLRCYLGIYQTEIRKRKIYAL